MTGGTRIVMSYAEVVTVFSVIGAASIFLGILILLTTTEGRRKLGVCWKALSYVMQRFRWPERCPKSEHGWVYGLGPRTMSGLIYGPLALLALGASWLLVNDIRFHVPFGTLFLMLCGKRITWMLEEAPAVNHYVQRSSEMNAQRMVNSRHLDNDLY